jgi:hypothetical protein
MALKTIQWPPVDEEWLVHDEDVLDALNTVISNTSRQTEGIKWLVVTAGVGYSVGNYLQQTLIYDTVTGAILLNVWYNLNTASVIAAPNMAHVQDPEFDHGTEATLQFIYNQLLSYFSGGGNNSTSAGGVPRTAGQTFIGGWEDITQGVETGIALFSVGGSAANGFKIEFSCDGTSVHYTLGPYTIAPNFGELFKFSAGGYQLVRVNYTQSATAGQLFIRTKHHKTALKPNVWRLEQNPVGQSDAELVKAVLVGKRTDGNYGNIATDNDDKLVMAADPAVTAALADLLAELELKADLTETQPVSVASLPLPTGAATQTTLANLLTELQLKADLTDTQPVSVASLPLPTGAATLAEQQTQTAALSVMDDWDESDRAKVNLIPAQAGVEANAGNPTAKTIRIVRATGANSVVTSVAANAANVTLKASNAARIKLVIVNDGLGILYVKEGATATTASYTYKLLAGDVVIIDDYSGIVDGIWVGALGNAVITETT